MTFINIYIYIIEFDGLSLMDQLSLILSLSSKRADIQA